MGRWFMGMSACDEFLDVKDEFFTLFYQGKTAAEIEQNILDEYKELDENDGEWHNVYFALAQCEWKCGMLREGILDKVNRIIQSDADIKYLKSFGASASDLKERKKVLSKFFAKITGKNEKPIKQRIKKPFQPYLDAGDVFVYKSGELYHSAIVLYVKPCGSFDGCKKPKRTDCYQLLIAASSLVTAKPPKLCDIVDSNLYDVAWTTYYGIVPKNRIQKIANIKEQLSSDYKNTFGHKSSTFNWDGKVSEHSSYSLSPNDIFYKKTKNMKFKFENDKMSSVFEASRYKTDDIPVFYEPLK